MLATMWPLPPAKVQCSSRGAVHKLKLGSSVPSPSPGVWSIYVNFMLKKAPLLYCSATCYQLFGYQISGFSELCRKKKKRRTPQGLSGRRLPRSPGSFLFVSLSGEPTPTLASGRGRWARKATEAFIIQITSKLRNLEA